MGSFIIWPLVKGKCHIVKHVTARFLDTVLKKRMEEKWNLKNKDLVVGDSKYLWLHYSISNFPTNFWHSNFQKLFSIPSSEKFFSILRKKCSHKKFLACQRKNSVDVRANRNFVCEIMKNRLEKHRNASLVEHIVNSFTE